MSLSSLLAAMPGAVSQGVMWGVMVLGVYITFRVLDVADLTVDGSFSLGSCTCAALVTGGSRSGSGTADRDPCGTRQPVL